MLPPDAAGAPVAMGLLPPDEAAAGAIGFFLAGSLAEAADPAAAVVWPAVAGDSLAEAAEEGVDDITLAGFGSLFSPPVSGLPLEGTPEDGSYFKNLQSR